MTEQWPKAVLVLCGVASLAVLVVLPFRNGVPKEPCHRGKSLSYWVGQLDTKNGRQAQVAVRAIGPKAVSVLLAEVRHGEALHGETVTALMALGPSAVPGLIEAFDDQCDEVRLAAIAGIGTLRRQLGPQLNTVVRSLAKRVDDSNDHVRFAAIRTLASLGPDGAQAVPVLVGVLNDKDDGPDRQTIRKRATAADALGRICPPTKIAMPALTVPHKDLDWYTRKQAALALLQINHDTNLVVSALSGMLKDRNASVRRSAAIFLSRISAGTNPNLDVKAQIDAANPPIVNNLTEQWISNEDDQ